MRTEVVDHMLRDHGEMHNRLTDWESALLQVVSASFAESQRGLEKLWKLVPFFEKEVARHFRDEEAGLYPLVERSSPPSSPALAHFARQHREFTRQWQDYKRELLYCDAVGETRRVAELGHALIHFLRHHMLAEEAELLRLVEKV